MKFFSIFVIVAILVLCLTASSEAGFGKKFKHAVHKVGHQIDKAGQHLAHTVHETAGAAEDAAKIAGAGAVIGGVVG